MAARAEDGVVDADHRVFGIAEPLRRRRQHAAHPGRGQPRADHHGAGRPRRRPAHPPRPPRADRAAARRRIVSGHPTDGGPPIDRVTTAVYTLPHPRARGRRHPALGRHHRGHRHPGGRRPHRAGLDLLLTGGRRGHHPPPRRRRASAPGASTSPPRWEAMHRACRNFGTKGLVHAGDVAPSTSPAGTSPPGCSASRSATLAGGRCRDSVPIYGSGGFTTLTDRQLEEQVALVAQSVGATSMKIKIGEAWGTRTDRDLQRVHRLRELAGPHVELMVDANGGYTRRPGPPRRPRTGRARRHLVRGTRQQRRPRRARAAARQRCAATSPPASTPPTSTTSPPCSPPSTASNSTPPAAAATPACCAAPPSPPPTTSTSPPTARPRSTRPSPPPCPTCATSNGSPTTPGSNPNSSTASAVAHGGQLHPATDAVGHGLTLAADAERHRTHQ